jgi:hypothetical protein
MKNIIHTKKSVQYKIIVIFAFVFTTSIAVKAQAPQPGSMIYGLFEKNNKNAFVAYVLSSDPKSFKCRFVHSNAIYIFASNVSGEATVISTQGGKYPTGSKFIFVEHDILDDEYGCINNKTQGHVVITKFDDGKAFLGYAGDYKIDGSFTVGFWHSGSTYKFDKNNIVLSQKGGTYPKGSIAKIFCAKAVNSLPNNITLPNAQSELKN